MTDVQMFALILGSNVITAAVSGCVTLVTSRRQEKASLQTVLNESVQIVLNAVQAERDQCQRDLATVRAEVAQLRGELNNTRQFAFSLMTIMRRNGVEIPAGRQKKAEYQVLLDAAGDSLVYETESGN